MKNKEQKKVNRYLEALKSVKLLRTQVNEAMEHFSVKLNADMVKLALLLSQKNALDDNAGLSKKAVAYLIKKSDSLKLKPNKGRLKDLVRVHKVIEKTIRKIKIKKPVKSKPKKAAPAKVAKPVPPVQPAAA